MPKQQKGWMTAKQARELAAQKHRQEQFKKAKKGKAAAPEYRETRTSGKWWRRG
jgi:hypothetical protein